MAKKQKSKPAILDLRKPHFKSFYYLLFAFFILVFAVSMITSDGASIRAALFEDDTDSFMDHYNSVVYNEVDDPYEILVVYPPLASLLYKVCNLSIPSDDYYSLVTDPSELAQSRILRIRQSFVFQFLIYAIVAMLIFLAALCLLKKGSSAEKAFFAAVTFISFPFLYMADRGNNVLLPVAFTIIFLVLYKHENKFMRELGLISLAVAIGLKLYPAAFLLILIGDKRYKELARELVYVFVLLILPFFVFYNGIPSMMLMLRNLLGFDAKRTNEFNMAGPLDFKRMFFFLYGGLRKFTGITIEDNMREVYANVCRYGLSAICGIGAIFSKKMWKRTMLLAAVIYGFPGSASTYILLFMVIPTALFLDEEDKPSFKNYLYLFLIAMTQVPFIMKSGGVYDRYYPTKLSSMAVLGLVLLELIDMIVAVVVWSENRKVSGKPFWKTLWNLIMDSLFRKTPKAPAPVTVSGAEAPAETGALPGPAEAPQEAGVFAGVSPEEGGGGE